MSSAVWGTFEACFNRPTLPAMRPGAANRITCHIGKFQGMTASTGPMGPYRTLLSAAEVLTASSASRSAACSREPPQRGGALGHLSLGRRERLAHLGGEHPGDVGDLAFEKIRRGTGQVGPLLERCGAVRGEGPLGQSELGLDLFVGVGFEDLLGLARGGIDGRDRHTQIMPIRAARGTPPWWPTGLVPWDAGRRRTQDRSGGCDGARPSAVGSSRRRSFPVGVWGSSLTRK